jgi:hypothetical protein
MSNLVEDLARASKHQNGATTFDIMALYIMPLDIIPLSIVANTRIHDNIDVLPSAAMLNVISPTQDSTWHRINVMMSAADKVLY